MPLVYNLTFVLSKIFFYSWIKLVSRYYTPVTLTQRTWAITEWCLVGTYFLTITEVPSEVPTNYFSNFLKFFIAFCMLFYRRMPFVEFTDSNEYQNKYNIIITCMISKRHLLPFHRQWKESSKLPHICNKWYLLLKKCPKNQKNAKYLRKSTLL